MNFELHPNLTEKIFVVDLPLCHVLLEDNRHYPWIFLVPRRPSISRIMDLSVADQQQLWLELDWGQKVLWDLFHPEQLNVAAIGNKTPQLHVHIIARKIQDPAWPNTVWGQPFYSSYPPEDREKILLALQQAFKKQMLPSS